MSLLELSLAEERLQQAKTILEKHKRTDLEIVAVNKMYDWSFVCLEPGGKLNYYLIDNSKIRREYSVASHFGPNYILVNDNYLGYESVELIKGRKYTCCSKSELESYLKKGWEVERRS